MGLWWLAGHWLPRRMLVLGEKKLSYSLFLRSGPITRGAIRCWKYPVFPLFHGVTNWPGLLIANALGVLTLQCASVFGSRAINAVEVW